jgi:hypothetical protein
MNSEAYKIVLQIASEMGWDITDVRTDGNVVAIVSGNIVIRANKLRYFHIGYYLGNSLMMDFNGFVDLEQFEIPMVRS